MVGIVIITYNIPSEVFILQIKAIQKYCKDEYTIEVFDNSNDANMSEAIRYHSSIMSIKYTKVFASVGRGSDSHSFAANTSYALLQDKYDYFFYLDHDCIPIKDFSVLDILGTKLIGGIAQKKPMYIWPGCFMFNNSIIENKLIDFRPNNELGLDTGGNLYKLIERYGEQACVFFGEPYHQNPYYNGQYNHYALIHDTFMHFIAASNWVGIEGNIERLAGLIQVVKDKTGL